MRNAEIIKQHITNAVKELSKANALLQEDPDDNYFWGLIEGFEIALLALRDGVSWP